MFPDGVHRVRWLSKEGWVAVFVTVKNDRMAEGRARMKRWNGRPFMSFLQWVAEQDAAYDLD